MRLGIRRGLADETQEIFLRQQRFVNDISHELRTPLTVICGWTDILERYGAQDPELFREAVTSIKSSAQNMQRLVDSLLFLARAEQGNQPLNKVPLALDELLKKFVEDYNSPRLQVTQLTPCKISGDGEFLKKMLSAFIDNALRYSPPPTKVKLELTTSPMFATLKIIDCGIGIEKDDCSKIFDRFYRTDKARTKIGDDSSVGLGLTVAKWIADRHNITIAVKSKPHEGSTFTLRIPTI